MSKPDPVAEKLAQSDAEALSDFDIQESEFELKPKEEEPIVESPVGEDPPKLADEPQEEEKKEPQGEDDNDIQKRLDEIQPKKNAHPDTAKGFMALKGIITEIKGKLSEAEKSKADTEARFSSLEAEYKGKVLTPDLETELKELRDLRRAYQIENDPDFQAKYSTKLQEIDARALGILRQTGLQDAMEKFIVSSGGVIGMYNSLKSMPEDSQWKGKTHQEFIEDVLMPRLPPIQKTRLEQAIGAGMDLRDEMSREIEHAKTHGSEFQQKKQEEIQKRFNESAKAAKTQLGKMAEILEYPDKATSGEKKSIDKHNARVKKAQEAFDNYAKSGNNPEKLAEALTRAAQSQYLLEEAAEKEEELKTTKAKVVELEEKLQKVKGSAATGRPSSAPVSGSQPQTGKFVSDEEALSKF